MSAAAKKRRKHARRIDRIHRRLARLPPFTNEQAEQQVVSARQMAKRLRRCGHIESDARIVERPLYHIDIDGSVSFNHEVRR